MVMKDNGNFERIVREIWENFERISREFKTEFKTEFVFQEILEKWKCDENGLPEKTALGLSGNYFI